MVGMISTIVPDGFEVKEHTIEVPWDRSDPSLGNLELFAREIYADPSAPPLAYFQGGPGNPGPRSMMPWIPEALKHYRIFLIDERGTGRSTPIDKSRPELIDVAHLSRLRPPDIAADAEELRKHLGFEKWDLLGNSFGGICIGSYMSYYPEGIGRAMLTGSIPPFGISADFYNDKILDLLERRVKKIYKKAPWIEDRIREVSEYLNHNEEFLPTGERLTSQRFRFVGVMLGEEHGWEKLAILLEEPFHREGGRKHLRSDFLATVGMIVSTETNPMWPVVHEQIFGGFTEGSVDWSCERVYNQREGFELDADPGGKTFYPFGNAFFRFHFDEDPAQQPFRDVVHEIFQKTDWQAVANQEQLLQNEVPAAVLLYEDDMFIPFEFASSIVEKIPNMNLVTHPEYQHDAIYRHGDVFNRVFEALPQ